MPLEDEAGQDTPIENEIPNAELAEGETETTAETVEPAPEGETEQPEPERTFTQNELDEIVQRRLAKERRRLEREKAQPSQPETPAQEPDRVPTLDDYEGDYDKFNEAMIDYKVDQRLKHNTQQQEQQAQQRQMQERTGKFMDTGNGKYDDFEDLILDSQNPVSQAMREYSETRPNGVDVAYYLATHRAEALKIAQMPNSVDQVIALNALESKLTAPPKTTGAPDPIEPSKPSAAVDKNLSETDDMGEFVRKRREQKKQRRR